MSSKYYYLVAGLPELSLEDSKLSYTVADFKTEIYDGLSASDQKLIDLFYLKFDNANVLKLLKDKEAEIDKRGNYSADELSEYISILREGGEISPKEFPVYLSTFITDYLNTPAESTVLHEDHLAALYYEYAMNCGNKFVSAWFEFNLNINNILVAFTSRKFKWDIASNVVGNTEVCEALRTSSARDFGLSGEVDVFESENTAGGVLLFGIPEYRLPKEVLARDITAIEEAGVKIHLNTKVGEDVNFDDLTRDYDAVYIATGTQFCKTAGVIGEDKVGVYHGLDFLKEISRGNVPKIGKNVVVVGGGNTAIDVSRTAVRMGAENVTIVYRRREGDMPAERREVIEALEEGVQLQTLVSPVF